MSWADRFGWTAEIAEDLVCDRALDATDDLLLAIALGGAAPDVFEGGLMNEHAHDHHAV